MADDEAFLHSIPKFLRRPAEPIPATPMFMTAPAVSLPPATDLPDAVPAPDAVPTRRPGALLPPPPHRPPTMASREPEAVPVERSEIVSLPTRRARPDAAVAAPAADFFSEARSGIETLFAADALDPQNEGDDAAFQVTLPRGVIRQIRILAARRRRHA